MKRLLLLALLLGLVLHAEVRLQPIDRALIETGMPIVDIRTPKEWQSTGIVKGSIPIMFFDERGAYNVEAFLNELNAKVDTKKEFALICNSGNRTRLLASFLSTQLHYKVIDLQGGILHAIRTRMPLEAYRNKP